MCDCHPSMAYTFVHPCIFPTSVSPQCIQVSWLACDMQWTWCTSNSRAPQFLKCKEQHVCGSQISLKHFCSSAHWHSTVSEVWISNKRNEANTRFECLHKLSRRQASLSADMWWSHFQTGTRKLMRFVPLDILGHSIWTHGEPAMFCCLQLQNEVCSFTPASPLDPHKKSWWVGVGKINSRPTRTNCGWSSGPIRMYSYCI